MSEDVLELELTGMAYGGDALGRDDSGRMTFVPFGIPGERVRAEIVESHKRWARARLLQVLQPSPKRIEARCLHYGVCGGCHYQHISYEEQLAAKRDIVREQLQRIGGFADPPVREPIPSPDPWGYRNHLRFSLTPEAELGFVDRSGERVFRVQECHLPEPPVAELWPQLELEVIPALQAVGVRVGGDPEDRMVIFHGEGLPQMELHSDLPASVIWLTPDGQLILAGEDHMTFQVNNRSFRVSGGTFFQVNSSLLEELVALAIEPLQPQSAATIFDLYAGAGLFSAFVAQRGAAVVGVEVSPWAAADYVYNLAEFEDVALYESSVELALPQIPAVPGGVIVDPPRAGLSRKVLNQLVAISPPSLVYISCDPATLARDGKWLARSGFQLSHITPIDLFPQTYHIETVSFWQS